MTISIVLRLALPALAEGRLAGQVEIVEDGTRMVVRDAHELVEAVRRHLDHGGAGSASAPGTASSAPGAAGEIGPPGDPDGGGTQLI